MAGGPSASSSSPRTRTAATAAARPRSFARFSSCICAVTLAFDLATTRAVACAHHLRRPHLQQGRIRVAGCRRRRTPCVLCVCVPRNGVVQVRSNVVRERNLWPPRSSRSGRRGAGVEALAVPASAAAPSRRRASVCAMYSLSCAAWKRGALASRRALRRSSASAACFCVRRRASVCATNSLLLAAPRVFIFEPPSALADANRACLVSSTRWPSPSTAPLW